MLTTQRLVAIPLPALEHDQRYRDFYRSLLENVKFCEIAFGTHLPARPYTDTEIQSIFTRQIASTWNTRSFGNFGLALLPSSIPSPTPPSTWSSSPLPPSLDLSNLTWVGYLAIRDALTTSIAATVAASPNGAADFPPFEEMIEIKYGVHESAWGKGFVPEAVKAVQEWSVRDFGIKRFIGCTHPENKASARVLTKVGYRETEGKYFQGDGDGPREWECVVADQVQST